MNGTLIYKLMFSYTLPLDAPLIVGASTRRCLRTKDLPLAGFIVSIINISMLQ